MLKQARERVEPWDIIVVGGGATGAGVAVDAATRGYATLLLEQHDFGKGTSSRSTKLVHGGVRYLEQGNVSLVMEALKERGLLRQNAPHLVSELQFDRAQLRLVGGTILRHRPEGLSAALGQIWLRTFADLFRRKKRCSELPNVNRRWPNRRRGLLRRPV